MNRSTLLLTTAIQKKTLGSLQMIQRWFCDTVIPTLTFTQLRDELKTRKPLVIDVREKDELVAEGKISGSVNIPFKEFPEAMKLREDKFKSIYGFEKPQEKDDIVIHCKLGMRAMKAAVALQRNDFKSVRVFPGTKDWIDNGGPLEK